MLAATLNPTDKKAGAAPAFAQRASHSSCSLMDTAVDAFTRRAADARRLTVADPIDAPPKAEEQAARRELTPDRGDPVDLPGDHHALAALEPLDPGLGDVLRRDPRELGHHRLQLQPGH